MPPPRYGEAPRCVLTGAAGRAPQERRRRQEQIDRQNAIMERKLKAIRKEPPQAFHAPNGKLSLKGKLRPGGEDRDGKVLRPSWPPKRGQQWKHEVDRRKAEIQTENRSLQARLVKQYKPDRESELLEKRMGRPVDGRELWKKRLSLYDREPPPYRNDTNVPKTLGMAICSATGLKSYFAADGHRLREHGVVPGVYYIVELYDECYLADAPTMRNLEDYYREGKWEHSRGAENSWIYNGSMALRRRLVREKALGLNCLTLDEIEAIYYEARAKEVEGDKRRDAEEAQMAAALKQEEKIMQDLPVNVVAEVTREAARPGRKVDTKVKRAARQPARTAGREGGEAAGPGSGRSGGSGTSGSRSSRPSTVIPFGLYDR